MMHVKDIRILLAHKLKNKEFVIDKTGVKTIEIMGQSFIADEPSIYGKPSADYIKREIEWYYSRSLYVDDIPAPTPAIWKQVSSKHGRINSNYGWCVYEEANHSQYAHCLNALLENRDTRRAAMIYMRPSMQTEYNSDGMSDFMCTWGVQYLLRNNKLNAIVLMRSNDVVFGYKNDYAWQSHILDTLVSDMNNYCKQYAKSVDYKPVERGDIIWNAGSLHVYENHFHIVENLKCIT